LEASLRRPSERGWIMVHVPTWALSELWVSRSPVAVRLGSPPCDRAPRASAGLASAPADPPSAAHACRFFQSAASRRDLPPHDGAHAGRTKQRGGDSRRRLLIPKRFGAYQFAAGAGVPVGMSVGSANMFNSKP